MRPSSGITVAVKQAVSAPICPRHPTAMRAPGDLGARAGLIALRAAGVLGNGVLFSENTCHNRPVASFAQLHDLTGKVAIVTGGSRGIGRAIAQGLAEAGADVVVASRKLEACEAAVAEIRASTGTKSSAIACHVGRWDDCGRLIEQAIERMGRLDVLVNNAGMSPLYSSIHEITEELFDKTIGVNLMTIGLASAYGPKVRVNAVLPGPFLTGISKGWATDGDVPYLPMRRMGRQEEAAPIVVHLASPASSFTTGAIIRVDGGVTRHV
jgi:NAD(P)-dependent dehydrogenase (short-subunit alcohol dehydrogenase family)